LALSPPSYPAFKSEMDVFSFLSLLPPPAVLPAGVRLEDKSKNLLFPFLFLLPPPPLPVDLHAENTVYYSPLHFCFAADAGVSLFFLFSLSGRFVSSGRGRFDPVLLILSLLANHVSAVALPFFLSPSLFLLPRSGNEWGLTP